MQRPPSLVVFLVVVFALFGLVSLLSLCLFACLRSFTDWCIAHRQQSREQKKLKAHINVKEGDTIRRFDVLGSIDGQQESQKQFIVCRATPGIYACDGVLGHLT